MRYDHIDGIAPDDSINRGIVLIIDCNAMQSETEYKKGKYLMDIEKIRCNDNWLTVDVTFLEKMCLQTVLYNVRTQHSTHSTTPLNDLTSKLIKSNLNFDVHCSLCAIWFSWSFATQQFSSKERKR